MRLDSVSGSSIAENVISRRADTGAALSLSEGDTVRAQVTAVQDGTATLRTSAGAILHARLEGDVTLTPGTEVVLTVQNGTGETLIMTLEPMSAPQSARDPALEALAGTLARLGFTPDAETVSAMSKLMSAYPEMSPEESAFFAAQKLTPDKGLLEAFRAMNSGGATAGALLEGLSNAASELSQPVLAARVAAAEQMSPTGTQSALPEQPAVSAPAMQAADASALAVQQSSSAAQQTPAAPAASASAPASPVDALLQAMQNAGESEPVPVAAKTAETAAAQIKLPDFGKWLFESLGAAGGENPVFTGEALAGTPLLEGLSARNLAGMAESLTRIAQSMPEFENERELFSAITRFAQELFLKPREDSDGQLADKLRAVREELYVKLAYFDEVVRSSGAGSKDAVLEQTQKLMDHVRMLSGLDRFVCLQLPVQFGEQKRNAELYICKRERNGKKRIDPEDARMLIALDLEHMGRLEAQVEIKGRDVSFKFEVENEEIASGFRQNTTKLHKMLDSLGYKFTNSAVAVKKSGTKLENALLKLLEAERGGFEVTV